MSFSGRSLFALVNWTRELGRKQGLSGLGFGVSGLGLGVRARLSV